MYDFVVHRSKHIPLFRDNKVDGYITSNLAYGYHEWTKHIKIDYHTIR